MTVAELCRAVGHLCVRVWIRAHTSHSHSAQPPSWRWLLQGGTCPHTPLPCPCPVPERLQEGAGPQAPGHAAGRSFSTRKPSPFFLQFQRFFRVSVRSQALLQVLGALVGTGQKLCPAWGRCGADEKEVKRHDGAAASGAGAGKGRQSEEVERDRAGGAGLGEASGQLIVRDRGA